MYIKAISSTIPGINPKYGELYPTKKILEEITREDSDFDPLFIQKACGIKTVSLTHDTIRAVREKNQDLRNNTLYEMLDESIGDCIKQLYEKQDQKNCNIKFHIHIVGFSEPILEFRLKNIRKKYHLSPEISTFFIEQGCSGFLEALKLCKVLLANEKDSNILVTAENNMMTHIRDRFRRHATLSNIDYWIWQVIFGEGVGSVIVGNHENIKSGFFWKIDHFDKNIVCDEWRVSEISNEGKPQIFVRAREVRQTYLSAIPEMIEKGNLFFGKKEKISYILHESNPKILKKVISDMNLKDVPSISEEVGTLACVSSFSLLDFMNLKYYQEKCYNSIVMALIGETHGNISAGFVCLTPFYG